MQHIAQQPGSFGRTFGFPVTKDLSFVVTLTDQDPLTINTEHGNYWGDNLLSNSDFRTGISSWTDGSGGVAIVQWSGSSVLMFSKKAAIDDAIFKQNVSSAGATEHRVHVVAEHLYGAGELKVKVGSADGLSDNLNVSMAITETDLWFVFTADASDCYVEIELEGGNPTSGWRLHHVSLHESAGTYTPIEPATPPAYTADDLRAMQVKMVPGNDEMWLMTPKVAPYKLTYTIGTDSWAMALVSFTNAPAAWTGTDWPGAVAFFQGRSYFSAHQGSPDSIWGSKSALYTDFTTGANDDDSFDMTMDQNGFIRWIEGAQDLLLGTERGEFIITSEGGLITNNDKQVHPQSANGSRDMQAKPIGNSMMYTSLDGLKVREMEYKFVANGWQSRDLSYTAEHIPRKYGPIKEILYAKDPESLVWCITEWGNLVCCTFDPANNIIGWHRHPTEGRVESGCVLDIHGTSVLWLLIDRELLATNQLSLEKMTHDSYMDHQRTEYWETEQTTLAGFTHLAGQTVQLRLDGATHPDVELDASGNYAGPLLFGANKIEVGIPYIPLAKTLPMDAPLEGESAMSMTKRWNRVFLRLLDSVYPIINGDRPSTRSGDTDMGSAQPLVSEDIDVRMEGWDGKAQITITETLPLPVTVTGLFGELNEERV